MLEMIKELCTLSGISGRENVVRDYIIEKIKDYAEYSIDPLGNLIVFKKGKNPAKNKVMLDAHMDEVGMMITAITSEGFLRFVKVGGIDSRVMLGRTVKVGDKGISGVVGIKPVHLVEKGQDADIPKADDLYIDIGAKSKEEAAEYIRLGDAAWFDSDFVEFGDGFIKAKALDDRAGCAILIELIRSELEYDTWFSFSVQEEIGTRGAQTSAFTIAPDYAIAVETTTAADISGVKDDKRVCICGEGGAVSFMDRRTIYSRELFDKAFEVAKERNIRCQPKTVVAGGNNAGAIHKSRGGVKTLTVSVPCRYLHSPGCVIKYSDAVESLKLIGAMAEEFAKW
ncbi:MAG: M42 family metallopeptidase [Clostridia bacterium]|nr:M42 family metallopeptidase [Clostridia bacterium]